MAEIKSTLELVMERTRNLTFSEEEKNRQVQEEGKKNCYGLLQKYLDEILDLPALRREYADLLKKYESLDSNAMRDIILERIDLNAIEGPLPELLQTLFDIRIEGLQQLGKHYRDRLIEAAEQRTRELMGIFRDQLGISGSAVLPNVEADPQWRQQVGKVRALYSEKLAGEKAALR